MLCLEEATREASNSSLQQLQEEAVPNTGAAAAGAHLLGVTGAAQLGEVAVGVHGAQEDGLELVHASIGKQKGGVIVGNHAAGGHLRRGAVRLVSWCSMRGTVAQQGRRSRILEAA